MWCCWPPLALRSPWSPRRRCCRSGGGLAGECLLRPGCRAARMRRRDDAAGPAERMEAAYFPTVREYSPRYGLDGRRIAKLATGALVMHPGPMVRGMEIASEVADSARSTIVEQVANGVSVRMAVLYLLLGGGMAGGDGVVAEAGAADAGCFAESACWGVTPADILIRGDRIVDGGVPPGSRSARTAARRRRPGCPARPRRPAHPPARARPGGRRDGRIRHAGRRAGRFHRGACDGEHRTGGRHGRGRRAGLAPGPGGGALRRPSGRRGDRRTGGRAAGGTRGDGRFRGPRPGVQRRRELRVRRAADAPGAGVRQGVRRRDRPARAGTAVDRRRPDERGRESARLGLAGWPAVAEEAIIARDVLLAGHVGSRLHVCHVSTAGSVEILRWAKSKGWRVTAEVTPHHLLLTDEPAPPPTIPCSRSTRRCGRPRTSRRCATHSPTGRSTASLPIMPRTRWRTRRPSGRRPGPGCWAWRRRCRSWWPRWSSPAGSPGRQLADRMSMTPALIAGVADQGGRPRAGRPGDPDPGGFRLRTGRRIRAQQASRSRNTPFAGRGAAGAGHRDVPARPADRPRWEDRMSAPAALATDRRRGPAPWAGPDRGASAARAGRVRLRGAGLVSGCGAAGVAGCAARIPTCPRRHNRPPSASAARRLVAAGAGPVRRHRDGGELAGPGRR